MSPGSANLYPAPLPVLPGSPVSRLADACSRHGVTAPRNTLGAEELASITESARGAGAVAAAKMESETSTRCAPEQGPPCEDRRESDSGCTWVRSSQARSAGRTRSRGRRRPHAGSGDTAGDSPRRGSRGRRVPCRGSRSSRAGRPGRSRPGASRAGCAGSSRSCMGRGAVRPHTHPSPPKCRFHPTPALSISLDHREIPCDT